MKSTLFLIKKFNDTNSDAIISQKKTFSQFFALSLKSILNFRFFQWKDDPHRVCIFEVTDSENVVRKMSKESRLRGCFDKQYGKRVQALLKSVSQHIYHIHWSLTKKLCSKKSLVLTCKILGLRLKTLATDVKYPVLNKERLTTPIQIQLSQKKKNFSQFFALFLLSRWNFENFQ